jgi:subtilisin-like proprotein convertase family protein
MRRVAPLFFTLVAALGCGDDPPRFGEVRISHASPRAVLTGETTGDSPALELAAGCAGVVNMDGPDHVVLVEDQMKLGVSATSSGGPIGLVIEHDGDYYCDSDTNTGHLPHLQITSPGTYGIRIASLAPGEALPYRLVLAPDDKDEHQAPRAEPELVAVSVTSEPSGARVMTEGGQVLGTTPALFEVSPDTANTDGTFSFLVESHGMRAEPIRGTPVDGNLELHATLRPAGPSSHELVANEPQEIRDFQTAEMRVEMGEECVIQDIEAEVEIRHTYVGDLVVRLVSPTGSDVTLSRNRGGARSNLNRTWRASDSRGLRQLVGTAGGGTWTLEVRDTAEVDIGTLDKFELRLTCAAPGAQVTAPNDDGTRHASRRRRGSAYGRGYAGNLRIPNIFPAQPSAGRPADVVDPWATP